MKLRLAPDQFMIILISVIAGILPNVIANVITASSIAVVLISSGFSLTAMLILLWIRPVFRLRFGLQIPLRTEDYPRYARKGIIAFVPAHILHKVPSEEQKSRQEYLLAAEQGDYKSLDFERSSFQPLVQAIMIHRSSLEHCWLISTGGQNGSRRYTDAFINFLRTEKGLQNCQFHDPNLYMIEPNDDEALIRKVRDMIDLIYRDAKKNYQLDSRNMIADFTNGLRSTSAGMILSCLDGARDVQFIGTHYDDDGKPTGELLPMLFRFEAQFVNRMDLP